MGAKIRETSIFQVNIMQNAGILLIFHTYSLFWGKMPPPQVDELLRLWWNLILGLNKQ